MKFVLLILSAFMISAPFACGQINGEISFSVSGSKNHSDLKFLKKAVAGKRVVMLGEFSHGAKEINLAKNRIISYLYEELGFNLLLIESGMGEALVVDLHRDGMRADQMLNGITGPWRTQEYLLFMDYLKSKPKLAFGGFDVQKTGAAFADELRKVAKVKGIELANTSNVETRFASLTPKLSDLKSAVSQETRSDAEALVADIRNLHSQIQAHGSRKQDDGTQVVLKTLENRAKYLQYFLQFRIDGDLRKRFAARDRIMAENVLWFVNELYPDAKVIISGHNYHVSKFNQKEIVMGQILAQQLGKQVYSIGIFGGEGKFANNARRTEELKRPTSPDDVQNLASKITGEASFLKIPQMQKKGREIFFRDVTVSDSFVDLDSGNKMNLSKSFDALILIKQISPPQFSF